MSHGLSYFSAVLVDISLDPYIPTFFSFRFAEMHLH